MNTKQVMFSLMAIALSSNALSDQKQNRPKFLPDGSVQVPAFELPPSTYLSDEAVDFMKMRAKMPAGDSGAMSGRTITEIRKSTEMALSSRVAAMKNRYPVNIEDGSVAGVPVKIISPKESEFDQDRVLINLHGGAFQTCYPSCGLLESIPIASLGGWKVITVDYRQGPEHVFPAASQDVERVYREILKDFDPGKIGVYGCSAGGVLTAQSTAWLQDKNLPAPGAIGIFGASAGRIGRGDSIYLSAYISGEFPPPSEDGDLLRSGEIRNYFEGADMSSPLVSPLNTPEVISKFPPSLIITGTRAMDLSGSVYSQFQMKKHGVDAELLVGEGLGHCYMYDSNLPESRDTFDIIVNFFARHLAG